MGWSPDQVASVSIWQFNAAASGYRRAHMSEKERAAELTPDEVDELSELALAQ